MDRIGVPVELGESPQGLSPRVRLGVGVLLGIAAVLVNLGSFPLFRLSSPEFFFGGALVLVAFVGFGPAAGWTAAVIQVVGLIAGGWQGALIFLVVPGLIDWLRRRTGSLMLAVIVFWMTIGWVLAAFVYVYVLGFGWDFFDSSTSRILSTASSTASWPRDSSGWCRPGGDYRRLRSGSGGLRFPGW